MEHQSLIPSPNDDGKKQKKGSPPLLVIVSTALLLLGLVFYGGEYWGSHHRALGDGPTSGDLIPFGDPCTSSDDCAIPPGWDHGFCTVTNGKPGTCQSGDIIPVGDECPNQYNVDKDRYADDHCAIPLGLDHGVCLGLRPWGFSFCQSGQPGAVCIDTFGDCVVPPGLDHPVCRQGAPADGDYDGGEGIIGKCQSGQPGSFCGQTSDCVIQTDLDPPHAVCRGLDRRCQR